MRRAGAIGGVVGTVLVALALGLPAAVPAIAQDSSDVRTLQDRLQRLDRELNGLQQRVYRGAPPPAGAAAAPPLAADASTTAVGSLQARMAAAEDELRATTGHIEEANATLGDLRARLDRLGKDLDVRLSAIEKAFAERPPAAAAATPAVAPGAAKPGAPPAKQAAAPPVKLPKGSAKEQYEFAFDLLKRSEYAQAEQALKQFVAAHPTDPLASNAQYWLGETLFVRSNFADAAQQFLVGYQKYGSTPKGPDYLYKLGLSLSKLNKKQEACAAYARFQKEYPSATGALRGRVADERQRLKCA